MGVSLGVHRCASLASAPRTAGMTHIAAAGGWTCFKAVRTLSSRLIPRRALFMRWAVARSPRPRALRVSPKSPRALNRPRPSPPTAGHERLSQARCEARSASAAIYFVGTSPLAFHERTHACNCPTGSRASSRWPPLPAPSSTSWMAFHASTTIDGRPTARQPRDARPVAADAGARPCDAPRAAARGFRGDRLTGRRRNTPSRGRPRGRRRRPARGASAT